MAITIEFVRVAYAEIAGRGISVKFQAGDQLQGVLQPYVVEQYVPVEYFDIATNDGCFLAIPYAAVTLIDEGGIDE